MRKFVLLFTAVLFGWGAQAQYKALVGGTLINSNGDKPLEDAIVLISKNKIEKVGKRGKVKLPEGTQAIDVTGKYLVPGLIDSHVHFFQSGGLYTRPDAIDLRKVVGYEEEQAQIRKSLPSTFVRYLAAGITAVADVGGPMSNFDVRTLANGTLRAPRVVVAGPLISTVDNPKLDIGDPPIVKVSSNAEVDNLVQQLAGRKADLIKIWFIVSPQLNFEENLRLIQRTIDQSHARGIRVAVHATQLATAKAAVRAGADILVHSVDDQEVDGEFITLLKQKGTIYTSSISVLDGYVRTFAQQFDFGPADFEIADPHFMGSLFDLRKIPMAELPERVQALMANPGDALDNANARIHMAKKNLKTLQDAGVTIATGTDAGNIGTLHASSMFQELAIMEDAGLSPSQILANSTLHGAMLMGKEKELGSIEAGKFADILVLDKNPLEGVAHYRSASMVMKDGELFSPEELLSAGPGETVQRQLVAYNAHDLDAFLSVYSKDVKLYNFPNEPILEGMEDMRGRYATRFESKGLYAEVVHRGIMGDYVIDQERVKGIGASEVEATIVFHVKDGLIDKVWFIIK